MILVSMMLTVFINHYDGGGGGGGGKSLTMKRMKQAASRKYE